MADEKTNLLHYTVEPFVLYSKSLGREVILDAYVPQNLTINQTPSLLLVNDGQDLPRMPFAPLLDKPMDNDEIAPILAIGIYCNEDRKLEYGTADIPDYMNRGSKAKNHRKFVLDELIPFVKKKYGLKKTPDTAFAGFSLGGLSAMDIAWKHPETFSRVGVFSGSFWWRLRGLENGYVEETDRIMHKLVREGGFAPEQSFFFQTGSMDETADRNNNGIIDSIDDTLGLIAELERKGYNRNRNIRYLELLDGRHDVPTWASAFPDFLTWGWGRKSNTL